MAEKLNATCDICGKKYHVCHSCEEAKSFKAWRTITDTIEHYKIFMVLSEYTRTKDVGAAREGLDKCDLSGKENFSENIRKTIDEIFAFTENVEEPKQEKAYKPVKIKARKNDIE